MATRRARASPGVTGPEGLRSVRAARSARTLRAWRAEVLAHHVTGARTGPTETLNLCVKMIKRCGHGFRTFEHYRMPVLLHAGGVTWPAGLGYEPALPTPTRTALMRSGGAVGWQAKSCGLSGPPSQPWMDAR
jgi:hypothetical protein